MKLPDDEINDRLRRALTDKFSNTKEQPDPKLANIVLNSIHRRTGSTMPYRIALTTVLVLLTTMRPERYTVPSRSNPQTLHATRPTNTQETTYSTEIDSITHASINPPLSIEENNAVAQNRDIFEQKSIALPPDEVETLSEKTPASGTTIKPDIELKNPDLLNNSGYISFNTLHLPGILVPKENHSAEKPKEAWNLLLEFTPMNTYQVVRIRSNQPVQYQNFEFPESFSNKKMAYQIQAGVERGGLQFHLGYAFSRQNFHYEIATNEFVFDKQNQVVRKGVSEQVDNTLHFGNIGISKELSFNKAKFNGYFVRVGADLSREFTTKQNLLWGTAAFGKEIPLGTGGLLNVGPYIEYSVNKMRSKDAGFMLQPYQAGISIQFKYRLKQNRKSPSLP